MLLYAPVGFCPCCCSLGQLQASARQPLAELQLLPESFWGWAEKDIDVGLEQNKVGAEVDSL